MPEPYASYQYEIYLAGIGGQRPEHPISYYSLRRRAKEVLSPESYGYVAGGASLEKTMEANLRAFERWRIVPRMLTDVGERDLSVTIFDQELPAPVLLAPIGVQGIIHDDGELATARAARAVGVPMVLSNASTHNMEDVAQANGDGLRWFQLYWPNSPELTESFLTRAEEAGYRAIVVTLDTRLLAWRPRDIQHGFLPFLSGQGIGNYLSDPVFRSMLEKPPEEDMVAAVMQWASVFPYPSSQWEDLSFIKEHTRLPVLLKGIQHPDDARRALDAGMDGIIVSNHGGRQVDGAIGSLDALPVIVDEIDGRVPVLFDSGIRSGADAVKALAFGAKAVLLGRPYAWGLAVGGEEGVRQVLRGFLADLDLSIALSGYARLDQLERALLTEAPA